MESDDFDIENIPGELRALLKALQNSDAARIFDEGELDVLTRAANEMDALITENDDLHKLVDFYRSANHKLGGMVISKYDVGLTVIGALEQRRRRAIEAGGVH